jgi:alpha-beta hydrolase superfamily lysophospholipase
MFGIRHGHEIMDDNPQIEKWILIGHSLGGVPASRIAAKQPGKLIGVALLATMVSVDLSGLDISAIRITAENDLIMNKKMMGMHPEYLPVNSRSIELKGANHTQFGAYKSFSRDGDVTMTWKEQQETAVRLILDFFAAEIGG